VLDLNLLLLVKGGGEFLLLSDFPGYVLSSLK
jgi:hypothetical protein